MIIPQGVFFEKYSHSNKGLGVSPIKREQLHVITLS